MPAVIGKFQSTLSVRRATAACEFLEVAIGISIHALRKESDGDLLPGGSIAVISIHALRKESDQAQTNLNQAQQFQSTLSVRRATGVDHAVPDVGKISIHALRKESDVAVERQAVAARISIHALRKESDEA